MMITPFEPRDPYIAVAEASFKISMLSISLGFNVSMLEVGSVSYTYKTPPPTEILPIPLILICGEEPGSPETGYDRFSGFTSLGIYDDNAV